MPDREWVEEHTKRVLVCVPWRRVSETKRRGARKERCAGCRRAVCVSKESDEYLLQHRSDILVVCPDCGILVVERADAMAVAGVPRPGSALDVFPDEALPPRFRDV